MTKQYLLGIDIGTSACKVALFGKDGKVEAAVSEGYPVYYPHPGWAEQNPDEWWEAVCKAIWTVISSSGVSPDDIAGIGIDGQSWSAIAIDEEVKKYVMQKIMVAGYTGQNFDQVAVNKVNSNTIITLIGLQKQRFGINWLH